MEQIACSVYNKELQVSRSALTSAMHIITSPLYIYTSHDKLIVQPHEVGIVELLPHEVGLMHVTYS